MVAARHPGPRLCLLSHFRADRLLGCGGDVMKKVPGFIACSIALTVVFYMLAYYQFPTDTLTPGIVLLFAAVAMVIVWAVGAGIKKLRERRAGGTGGGASGTGHHGGLAVLVL